MSPRGFSLALPFNPLLCRHRIPEVFFGDDFTPLPDGNRPADLVVIRQAACPDNSPSPLVEDVEHRSAPFQAAPECSFPGGVFTEFFFELGVDGAPRLVQFPKESYGSFRPLVIFCPVGNE